MQSRIRKKEMQFSNVRAACRISTHSMCHFMIIRDQFESKLIRLFVDYVLLVTHSDAISIRNAKKCIYAIHGICARVFASFRFVFVKTCVSACVMRSVA